MCRTTLLLLLLLQLVLCYHHYSDAEHPTSLPPPTPSLSPAAGKPVMFRAPPLVTRKRDKDIKEERNEDEEDLREFLTE